MIIIISCTDQTNYKPFLKFNNMATQQKARERRAGNQSQRGRGSSGDNRGSNHGNFSNRGFASMDAQKQREIASMGGRAAHESGHAHEFNSAEAREAGRKGGEAVSKDKEHMAEIGREGGRH
jgi:uncharacterized protein